MYEAARACSCGCAEAHVIARRVTADGARLEVWSDGTITQRGIWIRGLGETRSAWALSTRVRAARLMMDDFGIYDLSEIADLVKIAAKTFAHQYSSETDRRLHVRALFAAQK